MFPNRMYRTILVAGRGGGSRIDMVDLCASSACLLGPLLGRYFAKFGIAICGFSSQGMKESKLHGCIFSKL